MFCTDSIDRGLTITRSRRCSTVRYLSAEKRIKLGLIMTIKIVTLSVHLLGIYYMQLISCMASIPFSKRNDFLPPRLEVISSDGDESVTGSLKFFDFNFTTIPYI